MWAQGARTGWNKLREEPCHIYTTAYRGSWREAAIQHRQLRWVLRDDLECCGGGGGWQVKQEGMHVYTWLIHDVVFQKPIQHCKAITLQLNINLKNTILKFNELPT